MFWDVRMGRITGVSQTPMTEAPVHAEMNITASVLERHNHYLQPNSDGNDLLRC
jgi:hypothetical protein